MHKVDIRDLFTNFRSIRFITISLNHRRVNWYND